MSAPLPWRFVPCVLVAMCGLARGDGGRVLVSEEHGPYRVTLLVAPGQPRVGPMELSALVQDAATGATMADADVVISLVEVDGGGSLRAAATQEQSSNKLFRAAVFDVPRAGAWEVCAEVEGPLGKAALTCPLSVGDELPRWLTVWPWFGWPAGAVLVFCAHRKLAARRALRQLRAASARVLTKS